MSATRTRRILLIRMGLGVALAFAVVFVAIAVSAAENRSSTSATFPPVTAPPAIGRGTPAPGFRLARLGGGEDVSLASYAGHPVVLNFFASWCPDCQAELHAFAVASRALRGQVFFLAVDSNDSDPGKAMSLLRTAGDTYPVGSDPLASVAQRYLVGDLPTTIFIDPHGRVVGVVFGAQTAPALEHWAKMTEKA